MKLFLIFLIATSQVVYAIEEFDVVIAGAGVGGLSAAKAALEDGKSVLVLEATSLYGGRVKTVWADDREEFPKPVDIGAGWAHDQYINEFYDFLFAGDVPMYIFNQDDSSIWDNGRLTGYGQLNTLLRKAFKWWTKNAAPFRATGVSDDEAVADGGFNFKDTSILTYFQFAYEQWIGNNTKYHDSKMWDDRDFDLGPDHVITNGYITAIDYLIDKPPSTRGFIRFNSPVTSINYENNIQKDVITYLSNGVSKTVRARIGTIVSPSINVIKAGVISFSPPLPSVYVNAMDKLMCSGVEKSALFFDQAGGDLLAQSDLAHHYMFRYGRGDDPRVNDALTCFINWKFVNGQAVVTSFVQGDYVINHKDDSDAVRTGLVMTALREFIPSLPDPVQSIHSHWYTNPWTRCSYTDFQTGAVEADMDQLSIPFGSRHSVVFVGEASNFPDHGTVHAAFKSGIQGYNAIKA